MAAVPEKVKVNTSAPSRPAGIPPADWRRLRAYIDSGHCCKSAGKLLGCSERTIQRSVSEHFAAYVASLEAFQAAHEAPGGAPREGAANSPVTSVSIPIPPAEIEKNRALLS